MFDYVTLCARLELPANRVPALLAADVALAEGSPSEWRAWFDRAVAEGRLEPELGQVETHEDLLDFLDKGESWSQRWRDDTTLEVIASTGEGDPYLVRTSLLAMLFEAAAAYGARGYLYLLDAMHQDAELPVNLRIGVARGEVVKDELDVEQAWHVRDRVEGVGLWPVSHDDALTADEQPR